MNTILSNYNKQNETLNDQFFHFIYPTDNTQLTDLSKHEISQLMSYLKKYYLSYRQTLNFNNNSTFGIEIEFKKRYIYRQENFKNIYQNIRKITGQTEWDTKYDVSLSKYGTEICSPILTDNQTTWKNLKNVLNYLNTIGYIDNSCGGHIHIGTQTIGNNYQSWDNFIKIWIIYENIILHFFSGEQLLLRPKFNTWAPSINKDMYDSYIKCQNIYHGKIDEIFLKHFCYLLGNPHQAINFKHIKNLKNFIEGNTIEFRAPNGTLNPIIWQNNINLILNIFNSISLPAFNQEILSNRFDLIKFNQNHISNLYETIDLPLALEFCDLIFNNNLDKINFLKQYLKNFKTTKKNHSRKLKITNYHWR